MRRALVALIAVLYLAVSSGFTLRAHYCMGKEQGTGLSLLNEKDHHCSNCGMTMSSESNGCCKDEHKVVKLEQKHIPSHNQELPEFATLFALPISNHAWGQPSTIVSNTDCRLVAWRGPPQWRRQGEPIYLVVRSFRI